MPSYQVKHYRHYTEQYNTVQYDTNIYTTRSYAERRSSQWRFKTYQYDKLLISPKGRREKNVS